MVTCLQVYNIDVSTSLVNEALVFIYYGFGPVVVIMLANWCCSLLTVWVLVLLFTNNVGSNPYKGRTKNKANTSSKKKV